MLKLLIYDYFYWNILNNAYINNELSVLIFIVNLKNFNLVFSKNFLTPVIIKWPSRQVMVINWLIIVLCNKYWVLVLGIPYRHQKQFRHARHLLFSQNSTQVPLHHPPRDLNVLTGYYLIKHFFFIQ